MKFLIMLMIFGGIWLIQYIFRDAQEQEQKKRREMARRRSGKGGPRSQGEPAQVERSQDDRPRRTSSDLDRFLAEARRRRQKPEEEPIITAEVVPPSRQESPRPKTRPRPAPPPVLQPVPAPPPQALAIEVEPLPEEPETMPLVAAPVPMGTVDVGEMSSSSSQPRKNLSPTLQTIQEMLSNVKGTHSAVVLYEIFGPPKCKRKGRPGEVHDEGV